jgi:hypothetical protein
VQEVRADFTHEEVKGQLSAVSNQLSVVCAGLTVLAAENLKADS